MRKKSSAIEEIIQAAFPLSGKHTMLAAYIGIMLQVATEVKKFVV